MRLFLSIAILFAITSCNKRKADTIIHHAVIYTVDASFAVAEAMAIKDGIIVAVGKNAEIRQTYSAAENIDAQGQAVYPGFIDAHAHFVRYGRSLFN